MCNEKERFDGYRTFFASVEKEKECQQKVGFEKNISPRKLAEHTFPIDRSGSTRNRRQKRTLVCARNMAPLFQMRSSEQVHLLTETQTKPLRRVFLRVTGAWTNLGAIWVLQTSHVTVAINTFQPSGCLATQVNAWTAAVKSRPNPTVTSNPSA